MADRTDSAGRTVQDLILNQLKDLSAASGSQGKKLASISTGQQTQVTRLQALEKMTREIWEAELSCPARSDHEKVLKRISRIEAKQILNQTGNPDQTGQFDTTGVRVPIQVQPTADGQGFRVTGALVVKYLPWILVASMGLLEAAKAGFFGLWAQ